MTDWLAIKREIQGPAGFASWVREQVIPSGEQLANEARQEVANRQWSGREPTEQELRQAIDRFFCDLLDTEYQLYLRYEEKCISEAIQLAFATPQLSQKYPHTVHMLQTAKNLVEAPNRDALQKLTEVAHILRPFHMMFEQSLSQGRRTRAGGSPQLHFEHLLHRLGYTGEFETQAVLNGKVDFLFPNRMAWEKDRQRCIIVSIKRSLRERYKQVFEELGITGGLSVYLLVAETLEEARKDLTHSKIEQIGRQNVYLVVRDIVKQELFQSEQRIFAFSRFMLQELPLRRQLWKSLLEEH